MKHLSLISFFLSVVTLMSCHPETTIVPENYQNKLVIDGWIEQGDFPTVLLSYSSSYFSDIDSVKIRQLIETKAKVTVSDGEQSEVLTLKKDNRYFPPYIYKGTEFRGEVGKKYNLTIEIEGEKYTATTSIPKLAKLDKVWFQVSEGKDSLGYIFAQVSDDPSESNYYRVFTQRINQDEKYIPVYFSAVGDQYFNGKNFTFSILRGPENLTDVKDDLYFKKGDTVRLKFCTIDRSHFDFWRTLERELYVVGNPFSSSGNEIKSNIDNKKALGVWGGYGVNYYEVIAK